MRFGELKGGEGFFLTGRELLGSLIKLKEPLKNGNGVIVKAITVEEGVAVTKINDEHEVSI